jgi:phosphocarrier protein FPr
VTVGLVVVSHSRALAQAAVELAQEMIRGQGVPIHIAAGLDENTFGTDATAIADAVTTADQGQGVVVLMDIGSAVLSAELALELVAEAIRDRAVLSPAPLIEGLVVAAVAAAGGADAAEVAAEANSALAAKQSQLGPPPPVHSAHTDDSSATTVEAAVLGSFTLAPNGLHARPAARLVDEVRRHDAVFEARNLTADSAWVSAGSLTALLSLDARGGDQLELRVSGPQAATALRNVLALARRDFDETAHR